MTKEEIIKYINTQVPYIYVSPNGQLIYSDWQPYKPENRALMVEIAKEIKEMYIDTDKNRFKLKTLIKT